MGSFGQSTERPASMANTTKLSVRSKLGPLPEAEDLLRPSDMTLDEIM
jgi:hypothetical protein